MAGEIAWCLALTAIAASALAGYAVHRSLRLAESTSERDKSLIESAIRLAKAESVEEAVRANSLERVLTKAEESPVMIPDGAPKPAITFADTLRQRGRAVDQDGNEWGLG